MRVQSRILSVLAGLALAVPAVGGEVPAGTPDATTDLTTRTGVAAVKGEWRYSDIRIVETDFRSPGADLKPSGPPNRTYDFAPHAGAADFDDSSWEVLDPTTLSARRSTGKLCFNWYRFSLTVPERIGAFDPTGATLLLDVVVDDYAEVWVDGRLPRTLGQTGGNLVKGWNAPNRARDRPRPETGPEDPARRLRHQRPDLRYTFQLHLDALRAARLVSGPRRGSGAGLGRHGRAPRSFARRDGPRRGADREAGRRIPVHRGAGMVARWPPALQRSQHQCHLQRKPDGNVAVFRRESGYSGADIGQYHQPGSNGLAFDSQGRLAVCEHGNRRVTRLEKDGSVTVLADRFEGKRLNSPNDLVYRSDGTLYFTDPPFGLPKVFDDPQQGAALLTASSASRRESSAS